MGILMKNIFKKYSVGDGREEKVILDGISFSIEKGEMVAIRGKSGAGKSTLLHLIGILDTASSGEYYLDDIEIGKLNNKQQARLRNEKIGFILQDFGLMEEETVLYNVCLPMLIGKTKLNTIKSTALKKLEKVGMKDFAERKVSGLSGGEKQRVAIARALVNEPEYILADEPTGALDSFNSKNIIDIMKILHEEGKTVIIVTHDEMVSDSCEKVITIHDGRIMEM